MVIENVLPPELVLEIRRAIDTGPYNNGKDTAQGLAKAIKNNLQLSQDVHGLLLDRIGQAVMAHPLVQVFAQPRHISRPLINRYEAGMEYGMHVDQAYMGEMRTDVSFTLFLDDPVSYEGGELVIAAQPQQIAFKLPVGSMVVYTSGALHRVVQVTRGTRNAVVGWMQSYVRDADQRSVISRLGAVKNTLGQNGNNMHLVLQTNACIQELMRMWGE